MPATFALDLLARQQRALLRLAARIADHAGAAADDRDRRVAEALQPRQRHHRQQDADVQARRRRIEADVRGDALRGEHVGKPSVASYTIPRHVSSSKRFALEFIVVCNGLLYQSMAVTRRAVLKGVRSPPASARSPAPARTAISTSGTSSS